MFIIVLLKSVSWISSKIEDITVEVVIEVGHTVLFYCIIVFHSGTWTSGFGILSFNMSFSLPSWNPKTEWLAGGFGVSQESPAKVRGQPLGQGLLNLEQLWQAGLEIKPTGVWDWERLVYWVQICSWACTVLLCPEGPVSGGRLGLGPLWAWEDAEWPGFR